MPKIREKIHSIEEELAFLRLFRAALPYLFHLQTKQLTDVIGWMQRNLVFGNSVFIDDVYYKETYNSLRRALVGDPETKCLIVYQCHFDYVKAIRLEWQGYQVEAPAMPEGELDDLDMAKVMSWCPGMKDSRTEQKKSEEKVTMNMSTSFVNSSSDSIVVPDENDVTSGSELNKIKISDSTSVKVEDIAQKGTACQNKMKTSFVGDVLSCQRKSLHILALEKEQLQQKLVRSEENTDFMRRMAFFMFSSAIKCQIVEGKLMITNEGSFPVVARASSQDNSFVKMAEIEPHSSIALVETTGCRIAVKIAPKTYSDESMTSALNSALHMVFHF